MLAEVPRHGQALCPAPVSTDGMFSLMPRALGFYQSI
jgi:hypothetical protein